MLGNQVNYSLPRLAPIQVTDEPREHWQIVYKMETAGLHLPGVSPYHPGDDFEKWIKKVERYLVAINITDVHRKCAVLLHLVGDDIAETYETLPEPEAPGEYLFELCKKKLTAYLAPCRNVIAERMIFHGMKMEDKEDFEHFLGRLRVQLRRCGYTAIENERELRDRCVAGCSSELRPEMLQKAAARGDSLTLENVRGVARAFRDAKELGEQLDSSGQAPGAVGAQLMDSGGLAVNVMRSQPTTRSGPGACFRCGSRDHWKRDCPEVTRQRPAAPRRDGGSSGRRVEEAEREMRQNRRGGPRQGYSRDQDGHRETKRNASANRQCFRCEPWATSRGTVPGVQTGRRSDQWSWRRRC